MDKQYVVRMDTTGAEIDVAMSQMTRRVTSITKAAFKPWIHSVARQQSLGRRGMPGIWIVHSEVLAQYSVADSLPPDVAEVVRESEARRQKRKAKGGGGGKRGTPAASAANGTAGAVTSGSGGAAAVASAASKALRGAPLIPALPAEVNTELQRMAASGASEQARSSWLCCGVRVACSYVSRCALPGRTATSVMHVHAWPRWQ